MTFNKTKPKTAPKPADLKIFGIDAEPKAAFNWFPGHMLKAMREIKSKLHLVDLVLEIRDARVPLVSGNHSLNKTLAGKNRLILLNKANLADPESIKLWGEWFEKNGEPYLFVNCLDKSSMKLILTECRRIILERHRACNPESMEHKKKFKFMIIGLPNTGKSTLINQLANRNATKTADKPGQTQVQLWVKVDEDLELLDTPGVMPPEVNSEEHRLWLSAINAIPDGIIGEEDPACFLLKLFLKDRSEAFKARYKLDSLEISLDEALVKIATVRGCLKQKGLPDLDRVYKLVLQDFRAGELGKISFGTPPQT
ncbi:MAG TPA: ribosome biogenesis GTPase YlqF [Bacteriovoracaceae bacterium]|nr:ribosome biogenesis GTPase YlqF [Bacteriovoracaceae bacterium]